MNPGPRCLLLSLLLLLPARSSAAAPASDAPRVATASGLGALEGPATRAAWHFSQPHYHGRFHHPDRLSSEIGLGFLGVVVGGALGIAGSFLIPCPPGGAFDPSCIPTRLGGFIAGGLVGLPVGVWVGGGLMKGEGSLLATLLGSGVGGAGALGLIRASPSSSVGYLCLLALPMTFSMVAYEVTHALRQPPPPRDPPPESPSPESPPPTASGGPRLQPMVAVLSGGALLGLGGRF